MENLYERFTRMIETAVENEEKINVWYEYGENSFVCSFVPYEIDLQGKIYIEGEGCIINIADTSDLELAYDEFEDNYRLSIPGCDIYISI